MKYLKVNLWGKEIGRLAWDAATRRTYFVYNSREKDSIPDIVPLLSPKTHRNMLLPILGDDRPIYQGLPPFIADSLPDSWGNTLFDRWVKENKIPRNKVTPLYKLMFIGSRGMGALEYEPAASELTHPHDVDITKLYDLSLKILEERGDAKLTHNEGLTLQSLLAVGTSAGGRQMKAIIAINTVTGEICSGQIDGLDGFEYYILKFGDTQMPTAEIETAYFDMARNAGIDMEECRLFTVEGVNHFLTHRFDRVGGKKIYVQTLAAINPEARSYEDFVNTCRELSLLESDIEQLYRRMVFNVMTNNTDDHSKNFSFVLEDNCWRLAPAYDVTFIFNVNGTGPNIERRLSIGGKISEITKSDLLEFADRNDIRNAQTIIDEVAASIRRFDEYADKNNLSQPWRGLIQKTLSDNLTAFDYDAGVYDTEDEFVDSFGRVIRDVVLSVNSKRHYEISAIIDGNHRRRFIRPNMPIYEEMTSLDIYQLTLETKRRLIEMLLPEE